MARKGRAPGDFEVGAGWGSPGRRLHPTRFSCYSAAPRLPTARAIAEQVDHKYRFKAQQEVIQVGPQDHLCSDCVKFSRIAFSE